MTTHAIIRIVLNKVTPPILCRCLLAGPALLLVSALLAVFALFPSARSPAHATPNATSQAPTGSCSRKWGDSATAAGVSELSGPTSVAPFTSLARQAPDRIQSVSSPHLGRHSFATRFEVRPGDVAGGSSGWRAELRDFSGTRNTPYVGTEYVNTDSYYSFAWYFPDDFEPPATSSWGHLVQFHSSLAGGPGPSLTVSVKPGGGGLQSEIRSGIITSPSKTVALITPTLNQGQWNELIVRYKRRSGLSGSPGAEGLVQIWHRLEGAPWPATPQVSHTGPNYMHDGLTDIRPQALQIGFYRDATSGDLSAQRLFAVLPWRCDDFASAATFYN